MPSSDSSLWLGMNPGHALVETQHGDESLDGINAVSTLVKLRIYFARRSATIGSRREARIAGYRPNTTPTIAETANGNISVV